MEKKLLAMIQAVVALEWLMGGFEKIKAGADFGKELVITLNYFALQNPYPFYKNFLLNFAIPNKALFAFLVPVGEFLAGLTLMVGAFLLFSGKDNKYLRYFVLAALIGLVFMNLNFWFAAGWTGPSTAGLNLVVGLVEAVLFYGWFKVFVPKSDQKTVKVNK